MCYLLEWTSKMQMTTNEIALAIVLGLTAAALGAFVSWISSPSDRVLNRRLRNQIIAEMKKQSGLSLQDAVKHIAYLAGNDRLSEVDFRIVARELGYQTLWLEREIKSLEQLDVLASDIHRRFVPPHTWVYYMPRPAREKYQTELKQLEKSPEPEIKDVSAQLMALVSQVKDAQQQTFLDETIKCLQAGAHRAAIVMAWNLAYHHLRAWILSKHLPAFNAELTTKYSARFSPATCHDDFPEKESVTLEVCRSAGFLDKTRKGILDGGLHDRNRYAHPSPAKATGPEAAGYISKLLSNVILDSYFG